MLNFHAYFHLLGHYGFPAMFLVVFIENIGIPFPTEPAYIVGQAMVNQGTSSFWFITLVLTIGHLAGAVISYAAGRRIGKRMVSRKELSELQQKLANWYKKYGPITVLATRMIGYVRPWSSYVAGIAEVGWGPFLIYTIIGTVIFNIITLAITDQLIFLWQHYRILRLLINLSFVVGIAFVVWHLVEARTRRRAG